MWRLGDTVRWENRFCTYNKGRGEERDRYGQRRDFAFENLEIEYF